MNSFKDSIISIDNKVQKIKQKIRPDKLREEISVIENELSSCDWSNSNRIKSLSAAKKEKEKQLKDIMCIEKDLEELREIFNDCDGSDSEIEVIFAMMDSVQKKSEELYIHSMFDAEDNRDCYVEIKPGSGGVDSKDWGAMLFRMYSLWSENKGYSCEVVDYSKNKEGGIKEATILIKGYLVYGYLKKESGIHRLVRISPFNSGGKRQTSFCAVNVYPDIDESIDIEIKDSDLKIDTFRSSGAGGQHVNTTDSAVRITHIPTGVVAQSQSDRSQFKNKSNALKSLKAKILYLEKEKANKEKKEKDSLKQDISWGNQIRNYVLHPYQSVKDCRTNFKVSNAKHFLDGNIQGMINSLITDCS